MKREFKYIEDAFSKYFNENDIEVKKNVVLPINKNYIINLEIITNDKLIKIQDVVFDELFNLIHNGSSIKTDYIRITGVIHMEIFHIMNFVIVREKLLL